MSAETRVLNLLRRQEDGGLSAAELAAQLDLSRQAVYGLIQDLRSLGYEIIATPHQGYRLVGEPDALHADDLLARIPKPKVIGRDIRVFESTTSSNDVIDRLAKDGVAEGVVVFAEAQTKGRGRHGRQWLSPARKGLWFSILLRPALAPQNITRLTIVAAVALARALRRYLPVSIKWPNDILIRGRKTAGILTELQGEIDKVNYAILGIGIDVNLTTQDFPPELRKTATSLRIETGALVNRAEVAVAVLKELDAVYSRLKQDHFDQIASEWEEQCHTIGKQVTIQIGPRKLRGRAEALDETGALLVRSQHGLIERVTSGDVLLDAEK